MYIVMIAKEGSTKIVTFMTLGAGVFVLGYGHINNIVKMHYFFKKSSSLLPGIDQTNYGLYIVLMTKERSTKIVNFMTPRAGVLMLGCGHISHYSEYVVSSTLSIYSTLVDIVFRNYDAAFLYHR